ncbi:S1C family serine protease [Pleomorphomonas diazotrophica]|uniref:S1C family serine protease n=1 Tax=Pleomorphomonas diazotrophica TaxID=1166257 RepID=UPI0015D5A1F9|nr:serine protease [Pleomorphomonas diazotrophica]
MKTAYPDGVNLLIGLDGRRTERAYYLMFGSEAWDYEVDRNYGVNVTFDSASTWDGMGVGVKVNAIQGVALEGLERTAIDELAQGNSFDLEIGGRAYGRYPLTRTRQALAAMDKCIANIAEGRMSLEAIAREHGVDSVGPPPVEGLSSGGGQAPAAPGADREPVQALGKSDVDAAYSTGSGFFVNGDGYLLTNAHVIDGCKDAIVRQSNADVQPATIVARGQTNDLAILKVSSKSPAFGKFRGSPPVRLGDSVVVFGYPLAGFLSSTGNISVGFVSALAGAGDDMSKLQISAPVQSGNSGGAVVDLSGHVIGIVVSKSDTQARGTTGNDDIEVIQNVNFAIKADLARFFLDANQIRYDVEASGDELKTPDVADIARSFSVQVACQAKE